MTAGLVMLLIFAGLLGLAIGSFLNVVVYRVPAGKSLTPDSACPKCGTAIRKRDNIPVLSWLMLRGKCRGCAQPISARYPLVEAFTAVSFVAVTARFGPALVDATTPVDAVAGALELVAFLVLTAMTIALALIDLDTRKPAEQAHGAESDRRHGAAQRRRCSARRLDRVLQRLSAAPDCSSSSCCWSSCTRRAWAGATSSSPPCSASTSASSVSATSWSAHSPPSSSAGSSASP